VATNNGLAVGCVASLGTGIGGTNELACDQMLQDGDRSLQTNQITSVAVLADGRMIVGTTSCLAFIDLAGNRDVDICNDEGGGDRAPFDEVRQLALDPTSGEVWVAWNTDGGTAFGASLVIPGGDFNQRNNQEFIDVRTGDGLPSNNVRDIAVAPSGDVWFATSNGVARLDGDVVTTFDQGDGLPANDARSIAIDVLQIGGTTHEVAWTAMNGGLGRVDAAVPSAIGITSADLGFGSNDLTSVSVLPDHKKAVGIIDGGNTGIFLYSGL
jgi:ligand-binding sensor domain-containing protein